MLTKLKTYKDGIFLKEIVIVKYFTSQAEHCSNLWKSSSQMQYKILLHFTRCFLLLRILLSEPLIKKNTVSDLSLNNYLEHIAILLCSILICTLKCFPLKHLLSNVEIAISYCCWIWTGEQSVYAHFALMPLGKAWGHFFLYSVLSPIYLSKIVTSMSLWLIDWKKIGLVSTWANHSFITTLSLLLLTTKTCYFHNSLDLSY